MATASLYETTGISAQYGESRIIGGTYYTQGTLDREILSYAHTINSFGGFDTLRISIALTFDKIEEWISGGIGKHMEVRNSSGSIVWEGLVEKLTITAGAMSVTLGPLTEIANRVLVTFTDIDNNVANVQGTADETLLAEHTTSQKLYGIIEKILSGGTLGRNEANDVRDTYLQDNAFPRTSFSFNFSPGAGASPIINIECVGYSRFLDLFSYNNVTANFYTGTEKITDVLAADPNSVVDSQRLDTNAIGAFEYDNNNRTGLTVIKEVVNTGDGSGNRWLFYMDEGRTAYYKAVPEEIYYLYRLRSGNNKITTYNGTTVAPWDVRPGRWIAVTDLLSISARYSRFHTIEDLLADQSVSFIESISFTAPYSVSLTGSRIERTTQILAQYGLKAIE